MLEKQLAAQVEYLLNVNGWLWKHDQPGMVPGGGVRTIFKGYRGFPDYIAFRGRRAIVIELKSDKGRLTEGQKKWLAAAAEAGLEAYVWRPKDFDTVRKVLRP